MNKPAVIVYIMTFFSDKEKSIRLTEEQYLALKNILNENKFVEINGSLKNTSDIKSMDRTVEQQKPLGSIGNFSYYSTEELDTYLSTK